MQFRGSRECRKGFLSSCKMRCQLKGCWPCGEVITLKGYWQILLAEHLGLVTCLSPTVHRGIKILHELDFSCELKHRRPDKLVLSRQKGGRGRMLCLPRNAKKCSQNSTIPLIVQGHQTVHAQNGTQDSQIPVSD